MTKTELSTNHHTFKESVLLLKNEVISKVVEIAVAAGQKGIVLILLLGCPGDDIAMTAGAILAPTTTHTEQFAIIPDSPQPSERIELRLNPSKRH